MGGRPRGSGRDQQLEEWVKEKGLPFIQRVAEGKEKETVVSFGKIVKVPADLKTRIDAAKYLTDRARGKAPQAVEHTTPDNEPLEIRVIHVSGSAKPSE